VTAAVGDLLAGHPLVAGLPADALELLVPHAQVRTFGPGELILREGTTADTLYLVVAGHVAVEVHVPNRGSVVVETMGPGRIVGLSWASPPYRYQFDVRAVDDVEAVAVDAAGLRSVLADRPDVGFFVLDRLTAVILDRLQATRVRLLDLYGTG
jgi:CRP-like cAMP-binding protein